MSAVYRISAVTLSIKNMEKSCTFYSKIPGFKIVYGGSSSDFFTTFQIGGQDKEELNNKNKKKKKKAITSTTTYLNLELNFSNDSSERTRNFGRIIFHTYNIDKLHLQLKNDEYIQKLGKFENEPIDAPWGERFFHMCDPDGYQLSFAQPI
jgi:catechol 2,3-dioxygenase-like lactoylglutathione lyase family enzyme